MGKKAQKARIEAMKREIELHGGSVGPTAGVPDDIVEFFLREVLDCPDCMAEKGEVHFPRLRRNRGH